MLAIALWSSRQLEFVNELGTKPQEVHVLYTILIFGVAGLAERLPEGEREAILQQHRDLQAKLQAEGKYRGAVQLMRPSTAMNVQEKDGKVIVLDGPFAESKEQILGFYLVECDTMEEAIEAAKALPQGVAQMEVRPVNWAGGL
jgi:hypothetical protein